MDQRPYEILYKPPPTVDSTEDICYLDEEDIPLQRLPELHNILTGADAQAAFRAAWVLSSWGDETGFKAMVRWVLEAPTAEWGWYPHRLHGYDEAMRFALDALDTYYARACDRSQAEGEQAREQIFEPVQRIISLSSDHPFSIITAILMVQVFRLTEYLPALKSHLEAIIQKPDMHRWKITDCANMLVEYDSTFVTNTLAKHGYTLADFPGKMKLSHERLFLGQIAQAHRAMPSI